MLELKEFSHIKSSFCYLRANSKCLKKFFFFKNVELPIVSTEAAPAKDPSNKERSSGASIFINKDIIESILSPAPTLSTTLFAYAGHSTNLSFLLLIKIAPFFPCN